MLKCQIWYENDFKLIEIERDQILVAESYHPNDTLYQWEANVNIIIDQSESDGEPILNTIDQNRAVWTLLTNERSGHVITMDQWEVRSQCVWVGAIAIVVVRIEIYCKNKTQFGQPSSISQMGSIYFSSTAPVRQMETCKNWKIKLN